MDKNYLISKASYLIENLEDNYISEDIAISEKVVGMRIYESPVFGFGDPEDDHFKLLKKPSVIGEHFLLPKEWLPQAKTVISFFLPFSEAVKKGNIRERVWPSEEWLHGRIEGQFFLNKLARKLQEELIDEGYKSIVPSLDERFSSERKSFTSNWSERHVAFICGLGTFGLSKGLITEKGIAGRFGSIITELKLPPDNRKYKDLYEYCSMCGKCIIKCPVKAISKEKGKEHLICSRFIDKTSERYNPRYGCGKCQVGVPCESGLS